MPLPAEGGKEEAQPGTPPPKVCSFQNSFLPILPYWLNVMSFAAPLIASSHSWEDARKQVTKRPSCASLTTSLPAFCARGSDEALSLSCPSGG